MRADIISRARLSVEYVLPAEAYKKVVNCAEWLVAFILGIWLILHSLSLPKMIFFFGVAPGDDLLCTTVLRELRKRNRNRLMMVSNHRELFIGTEDAEYVRPARRPNSIHRIYSKFTELWGGNFKMPLYGRFDGKDQTEPPSRHIIAEMCASAGIIGRISIRPYLHLSGEEKSHAAWARGQIVIQSSGMAAISPMRNKEWFAERFQSVIDALRDEYKFTQLGSRADPALDHVQDLRGCTTIREAGSILYQARLYVGGVGFLMHLARAVECPSVIVYGGREAPWQSGYISNLNLYSALPCSPCWRWNSCDIDRRCMEEISVDDVVSAIQEMIERPRAPLPVETVDIMPKCQSLSKRPYQRK
jgi:Glycosyltransferase family 9 (heptosyltransferase)